MDITYYKLADDTIVQKDQEISPEDWNAKLDWINIRTENRKDVADYFDKLNLLKDSLDCVEHPERFPFSNTFGNIIILNLSISKAGDIYQTDYISVILKDKLIITITPKSANLFNELNLATYSPKKFPSLSNFLFYILAVKILARGNTNLSHARTRLQGIVQLLNNEPEELSTNDLMSAERDVNQLSDIIEDQHVGFQIITSLGSGNDKAGDSQQTNNLIKGFEPLDKAMQRLEKKAESLRLQYMLYQQEKSTRKINLLTIIQAIFVPLTFIAGVYGMNFLIMPELNWEYGYLLVWLIFIGMASGLLIYFYRKGWFD